MKHNHFVAILLFAAVAVSSAQERTFTNTAGRKITASIVEISGEQVILKMRGKNYPVPIASLSAADQKFIKEWGREETSEPKGNWDAPWPKLVKTDTNPEIEIVSEGKSFVYNSPSFQFHCDVRLSNSVVERFSVLFEATAEFCRQLPLALARPHVKREKRFKVELFSTKAAYVSAGAPSESSGVYMRAKDTVMVPLASLGVERKGNRYIMDHDKDNGTLSHEIVHQMTDQVYYSPGAIGWFSEGLAEYVALCPYRSGSYSTLKVRRPLIAYVTAYGKSGNQGLALGEEINLPSIENWMTQSFVSFLSMHPVKTARGESNNRLVNYGGATLIFYYFVHMDGEGDAANLKAYCQALKQGKQGADALKALLAGRTYDKLEEQITKAWRGRGINITFR